jgi:uncharacterized protein (UPF0548 family)
VRASPRHRAASQFAHDVQKPQSPSKMSKDMLRLRKPSEGDLRRVFAASERAEVTYDEARAGYRLDHYERRLGTGEGLFERAVEALRHWQSHIGAGVDVFPHGATVEDGGTVLFVLRAFGVWTIAPCRVVYVREEPSRFSFAYGTLPGHPERGEVTMTVSRGDAGTVTARLDSFSRTVDPLARAALPLTRIVQKRVTSRYLQALAAAAGSR